MKICDEWLSRDLQMIYELDMLSDILHISYVYSKYDYEVPAWLD